MCFDYHYTLRALSWLFFVTLSVLVTINLIRESRDEYFNTIFFKCKLQKMHRGKIAKENRCAERQLESYLYSFQEALRSEVKEAIEKVRAENKKHRERQSATQTRFESGIYKLLQKNVQDIGGLIAQQQLISQRISEISIKTDKLVQKVNL